jgi:hypothetical protein
MTFSFSRRNFIHGVILLVIKYVIEKFQTFAYSLFIILGAMKHVFLEQRTPYMEVMSFWMPLHISPPKLHDCF